jgi:hypothetical protein
MKGGLPLQRPLTSRQCSRSNSAGGKAPGRASRFECSVTRWVLGQDRESEHGLETGLVESDGPHELPNLRALSWKNNVFRNDGGLDALQ